MKFVLVLIFSPFNIGLVQYDDLSACVADAHLKLGESMEVIAWDNMGGSNPIPKVAAAFCAEGEVK